MILPIFASFSFYLNNLKFPLHHETILSYRISLFFLSGGERVHTLFRIRGYVQQLSVYDYHSDKIRSLLFSRFLFRENTDFRKNRTVLARIASGDIRPRSEFR